MSSRTARDVHRWQEEALADRVVTFAGPDAAVVRVRRYTAADEPGQRVWRAHVLDANLQRVPVNTAVSQILAQLIREHYPGRDWSREWDYHVPERRLRTPAPATPVTGSPGACSTCGTPRGQERFPA